jgi:GTP pyrophosphokinase
MTEKITQLERAKNKLLTETKKYLPDKDIERINEAIEVALVAHGDTLRKSGEPYLVHPIKTAIKLTELQIDKDAIIAAILHDTLEDTKLLPGEIKRRFGQDVLNLVEAVTKLGTVRIKKSWFPFVKLKTDEIPEFERQIETLRKMLIGVAKDTRVILIKLADKIHNLETLKYLPEEKRERIARESLDIFAPIAQRLGIGSWQGEIEDLAFPFVLPEEYKMIENLAVPEIREREKYLKKISRKINDMMVSNKIDAQINFRAKRWYSLFKKLEKYDNDITKIHDLVAVRIIVSSVEQCYATLGILHSLWKPLPGRIKDYIALPKPNGYQSLHTTVFCDEGRIVEFQIRSTEMDYRAKFGIASHWIYDKDKKASLPNKNELKWIREFYVAQKNIKSPQELSNSFKMDLFEDRIFVFTPQGDVKDLPAGATPIDFAYRVHTDLGNRCAGAIVNGKMVSFETVLNSGDIVEIIEKKSAKPREDWLKYAKTQGARSQIKRVVKKK